MTSYDGPEYHRINVRVVSPHEDVLNDYHQWVYVSPFLGNCLGIFNPRMHEATWQKWRCNNPDCAAWAVVSETHIGLMIDQRIAIDR